MLDEIILEYSHFTLYIYIQRHPNKKSEYFDYRTKNYLLLEVKSEKSSDIYQNWFSLKNQELIMHYLKRIEIFTLLPWLIFFLLIVKLSKQF